MELGFGDCCLWCQHSSQGVKEWNGDFYFTYCSNYKFKHNVATTRVCEDFIKLDCITEKGE
jgi:hypothetical protein